MIKTILILLNVDITKLKFIKGTDYQLTPNFTMDVYKMNAFTTINQAKHAAAEVVKQNDNPLMTGLLYPILQALDEEYLDVDAEFSGIDQRKIFTFAIEKLPKLNYKKRLHFMVGMVPGLRFKKKEEQEQEQGQKEKSGTDVDQLKAELIDLIQKGDSAEKLLEQLQNKIDSEKVAESVQLDKMSASNLDSKIDLLDTKNQVKKKINRAYCFPGDIEDNTPMVLLKKIIFPILELKGRLFIINRKEKFGGPIEYNNFEDVKNDFKEEKLHPGDLKFGIIDNLNTILDPIREKFANPELVELIRNAYNPKSKKESLKMKK